MEKAALRERVWDALRAAGEARFPFPPHGRIPNFAGADDAADRLAATPEWEAAAVLKANPDAPQLPVRRRALRAGKTVYVAAPRLRDERPFRRLDPAGIDDLDAAATVSRMDDYAEPVRAKDLPEIGMIVSGSVAVTPGGARVGKGEGYSDLEFAVLRELGAVGAGTTVATTVHGMQVVDRDRVSPEAHDAPVDLIATPDRLLRTRTAHPRPGGIDPDALDAERVAEMPLLERFL